ncbi:MAG: hypothetical protein GY828_01730 [Candidatus Gracilibacteria bacterium]|nr:hypothetical protein [Candidatus Gracilibacteria bacterium]
MELGLLGVLFCLANKIFLLGSVIVSSDKIRIVGKIFFIIGACSIAFVFWGDQNYMMAFVKCGSIPMIIFALYEYFYNKESDVTLKIIRPILIMCILLGAGISFYQNGSISLTEIIYGVAFLLTSYYMAILELAKMFSAAIFVSALEAWTLFTEAHYGMAVILTITMFVVTYGACITIKKSHFVRSSGK